MINWCSCLLGYSSWTRGIRPISSVLLLSGVLASTAVASDNQAKVCARLLQLSEANPRLNLVRAVHEDSQTVFVGGRYRVFENPKLQSGREIELYLLVIPARSENPAPDPIFVLHGGPGAAATAMFNRLRNSWLGQRRDIVLIDQRGTGRSNPLHVAQVGSDDDLQTYFEPLFQLELYRAALPKLQKIADLTQYTTPIAVDDFDEIRAALGYQKINLRGGSYGSRSALVYMRRHPASIRTATLQGIAPIAYLNPLPQAGGAQSVLDRIFEECRANARCEDAFPNPEHKFGEILTHLAAQPVEVQITHPVTSLEETVVLDRDDFAEAVRVLMYNLGTNRRLPMLLTQAYEGDFRQFAQAGLRQSRGVRRAIAFGMLMSVTGSEDISRIDPADVDPSCASTFMGCIRLKNQMAIADIWPRGTMPPNFSNPVSVDVPVVFFSGTHDPATTAYWGAEAAKHMPNSLHLVVPGAHGVSGPAVQGVERAFLKSGTVEGLDLAELKKMKLPPFVIPDQ